MHVPALLATTLVVGLIDGGLLFFCIGLADTTGQGVLFFLVGGGPPTLFYAGCLYAWFKKRLTGQSPGAPSNT